MNYKPRNKFLLLIVFLFISISSWATEANHKNKTQISFCDQENIKSFFEAKKCNYSTTPTSKSISFKKITKWIKIETTNLNQSNNFSIKIEPFILDKIDVYYQSGNEWNSIVSGATQKTNPNNSMIAGYRVIVPASQNKTSIYFVSVTAPAISLLNINISEWPEAKSSIQDLNLGFGIHLGLLTAIFIFSIINFLSNRTIAMWRFSLFSADLLLCLIFGSGLAMELFLPNNPELNETLFHSLLCLRIGLWVWVMQAVISHYKISNWYKFSCYFIYILIGLEITIYPFIGITFLSSTIGVIYFIAPIIQIVAVHKTEYSPKTFKKILTWGFALTSALFLTTIISLVVFNDVNSKWPLYISRLTDFTGPLVLLGIITYRNRLVHKELNEVKINLNAANIRSEFEKKLLEDRQTLIDMLAHELKNPLTSISLAVDNLSLDIGNLPNNQSKRIEHINQSIKNMDEIIERCNLMNSLENQKITPNKELIYIKEFIAEIISNLENKNRIEASINAEGQIFTDAKFLKIILTNLLQNALKYSSLNSIIKINTINKSSSTEIEITNEVELALIPEKQDIFTRYYRHPLAQEHRGAGLGLFLSKRISGILGGDITYHQKDNLISFTLTIPNL